MTDPSAFNRELGLRINREIWNEGRLDRLADHFSTDFFADRAPYGVIRGLDELRASVERSHAAFDGFREDVKAVVADERRVVVHFTIRGRHTGPWGPLPPTGREVSFDEIVIMEVRGGKVCAQSGVIDNLTGLRQVGALPTPRAPEPPADTVHDTELAGDVQGRILRPAHRNGLGVLVITGSSGRVDVDRARLFAERGAVALAQRWWGGPEQEPGINEVPLERFLRGIDVLVAEGCDRIAMIGSSYGAVAALLTATRDPRIDVVIAESPSHVVWQCSGVGRDRSA